MKKISTLLSLVLIFVNQGNSQNVTIGTQTWSSKNLDVSTFRNGDPIPQAKTIEEWMNAGNSDKPAWCYYENDEGNGVKYGKLYNWYAVNDPRSLAPEGYHIPSQAEWKILTDFLGDKSEDGIKMKSNSGWDKNTNNGTNSSGFSGFPGGYRMQSGTFTSVGFYGVWWSSTMINSNNSWYHYLGYYDPIDRYGTNKICGFSVRCIKD